MYIAKAGVGAELSGDIRLERKFGLSDGESCA